VTFSELTRRFDAGARLVEVANDPDGVTPLFILDESGALTIVTAGLRPEISVGDTMIGIAPAPLGRTSP
jgi:hypothetical protein